MSHKIQEREDRNRGRFERAGMAKSLGRTLTRTDYHNMQLIKEGLRKHWLWYNQEMNEDDFRAIVRARIDQAKGDDAQANKATEILFRYALGSEAPTDSTPKVQIQILAQELNAYLDREFRPEELSPEEAEIIEALPEGDWILASQGANADSPEPGPD